MAVVRFDLQGRAPLWAGDSRLRLHTLVRLRWVAVLGQLIAVAFVSFWLGYDMPVGYCLGLVALSAWLNVFLSVRFPARHRLTTTVATALLAYDILQLAALLYLTGGVENPFTVLLVAPVTVSAAALPPANTVILGVLAAAATLVLVYAYRPLPWMAGLALELPYLYKLGVLAAINSCMTFLAFYAWRLTKESREMSAALAATEHVLAREQKLHALDGLAAAAAHELGTPLGTIVLTTKEMLRDLPKDSPHFEDVTLLSDQAQRCREILQKLTRQPDAQQDPLHASVTVRDLISEASGPYRSHFIPLGITAGPVVRADGSSPPEPVGERRPGVIFGLGNIIENAIDFARNKVEINAQWSDSDVTVTIADDGPGFAPDVVDTLGEPYVTTRPLAAQKKEKAAKVGKSGKTTGLGLGFFIAKTLLERSGAVLAFENRPAPQQGAVVRITWSRRDFEALSEPAWKPQMLST